MNSNFLKVLYAEHANCMSELEKTQEYQKVKSVENAIKAFGGTLSGVSAERKKPVLPAAEPSAVTVNRKRKRQPSGYKERVEALIEAFLLSKGGHASKSEIFTYLQSQHIVIDGKRLSWCLAVSDKFDFDSQRKIWILPTSPSQEILPEENTALVAGASVAEYPDLG